METDPIQREWPKIRERIHATWEKLSHREIDALRLNLDGIVGKIQKLYGYAKDQAEREYHEFRLSLRPLLHPAISLSRPPPIHFGRMMKTQRLDFISAWTRPTSMKKAPAPRG